MINNYDNVLPNQNATDESVMKFLLSIGYSEEEAIEKREQMLQLNKYLEEFNAKRKSTTETAEPS